MLSEEKNGKILEDIVRVLNFSRNDKNENLERIRKIIKREYPDVLNPKIQNSEEIFVQRKKTVKKRGVEKPSHMDTFVETRKEEPVFNSNSGGIENKIKLMVMEKSRKVITEILDANDNFKKLFSKGTISNTHTHRITQVLIKTTFFYLHHIFDVAPVETKHIIVDWLSTKREYLSLMTLKCPVRKDRRASEIARIRLQKRKKLERFSSPLEACIDFYVLNERQKKLIESDEFFEITPIHNVFFYDQRPSLLSKIFYNIESRLDSLDQSFLSENHQTEGKKKEQKDNVMLLSIYKLFWNLRIVDVNRMMNKAIRRENLYCIKICFNILYLNGKKIDWYDFVVKCCIYGSYKALSFIIQLANETSEENIRVYGKEEDNDFENEGESIEIDEDEEMRARMFFGRHKKSYGSKLLKCILVENEKRIGPLEIILKNRKITNKLKLKLIEIMLTEAKYPPDECLKTVDYSNFTALHYSIAHSNFEFIKMFVEKGNANLNKFCSKKDDSEMELNISNGSIITNKKNRRSSKFRTSLFNSMKPKLKSIESEDEMNMKDQENYDESESNENDNIEYDEIYNKKNAVTLAIYLGVSNEITKYLLEKGGCVNPHINENGNNVFESKEKSILSSRDFNFGFDPQKEKERKERDNRYKVDLPLYYCVVNNNIEILKLLLFKYKADVNFNVGKLKEKNNMLHFMVMNMVRFPFIERMIHYLIYGDDHCNDDMRNILCGIVLKLRSMKNVYGKYPFDLLSVDVRKSTPKNVLERMNQIKDVLFYKELSENELKKKVQKLPRVMTFDTFNDKNFSFVESFLWKIPLNEFQKVLNSLPNKSKEKKNNNDNLNKVLAEVCIKSPSFVIYNIRSWFIKLMIRKERRKDEYFMFELMNDNVEIENFLLLLDYQVEYCFDIVQNFNKKKKKGILKFFRKDRKVISTNIPKEVKEKKLKKNEESDEDLYSRFTSPNRQNFVDLRKEFFEEKKLQNEIGEDKGIPLRKFLRGCEENVFLRIIFYKLKVKYIKPTFLPKKDNQIQEI